jgi:dUTP pyrophosphatase
MMNNIPIRIINKSDNPLPTYATSGASGMDIRAFLEQPIELKSGERCLIPTGLFVEIPNGYELQVRPRSGMALKQGITCLNTPGTIDSDYRGEIGVILINLSNEIHIIQSGDRIAQLVPAQVPSISWNTTDQLDQSDRGEGGFGHTGHQ